MNSNTYYHADRKEYFKLINEKIDNYLSGLFFNHIQEPYEDSISVESFETRSFRVKTSPKIKNNNENSFVLSFELLVNPDLIKNKDLTQLNCDSEFFTSDNLPEDSHIIIDGKSHNSVSLLFNSNHTFDDITSVSNYLIENKVFPIHIMLPKNIRNVKASFSLYDPKKNIKPKRSSLNKKYF